MLNHSVETNRRRHTSIEAVLFDLDGTLVDSLDDIAVAANKTLKKHGYKEYPVEAYKTFVGRGVRVLIERMLGSAVKADLIEEMVLEFKAFYDKGWQVKTAPYEGIPELLGQLVRGGIRLAVLSNKPDQFTRMIVEYVFPEIPFAPIWGQKDMIPAKPDPQGALLIAEELSVKPQACLFVGDTGVDILTGKRAGMKTIGVTWGFRSSQELESAGADAIITKPDQLIQHALLNA